MTVLTSHSRAYLLVPLLLVTMAVGACDSQPLGSVDGGMNPGTGGSNQGSADGGGVCRYGDAQYAPGASFPAGDGCNTCTCSGTLALCTAIGCVDAGRDAGAVCTYNNVRYGAGASFPAIDGCNTCTCGADGLVACTERACADAGRDAGVICEHNGTRYMPGASFPAGDGCNTCNCTETGFVACTRRACPADGGGGVCTPGADHTCNDDPTMSAIAGVCRTDGTCDCSRTATNPRTGKCVPVPTDGGVDGCSYRGAIYPVGSSFPSTDGCNTCTCTASGVACTARACPPTCDRQLDASYQYGDVGGLRASQDRVALTPPMSYVYTRTDFGTVGGVQSCAPPMPPCGSAVIDVGELVAAFGHVDVQKALAAASPPLYGVDTRPVDGTVFELLRADGRGFRVGRACQSTGTELVACPAIPAGVQALVDVLGRLDAQQLKDPACGMLAATR